jgi:addiction module RelE/StbE family toxin
MKIRWSPTAVSDLKSIREYIASDNPTAARKVAARIKQAANRLMNFPMSGRAGRVPGTRELVIPGTSYIAAYSVQSDKIEIAAVLHGRQNWPDKF